MLHADELVTAKRNLRRFRLQFVKQFLEAGAFPDRTSALRLITALALQVTSIWRDHLYLDMSLLTHHHAAT